MVKFVIIVIFLFVVSIAFAEESPKLEQVRSNEHESATNKVQETANNEKDNPSRFEIELLKALRAIADSEKSNREQDNANTKSWNSPSVLINIGLLVVGTLYTIFALGQWCAIRRQANIAETSLKKIGRAYLYVIGWKIFNFEPGKNASIVCFITTAGQRPAILKGNFSEFCFSEKLPPIPDYTKKPSLYNGTPITIQPGMSTGLSCAIPKEKIAEHYEAVRSGQEQLYFNGYFTYDDPIDGEHKTTFFVWYDPKRGEFSQVYDMGYNTSD